jgi:indolepyruvate ferredoxin oxidoreductase alpha subunit
MSSTDRQLLSGNSAMALAARQGGVALGAGYPGTPSTEILEAFASLGGEGRWSPNEKVALEVGIGAAYAGARALVTMKHVGLNVAADPLFSVAHTGVVGALVIVSADDPGMSSSQNEQDNRRYAVAAAVPMLEPADSQEAYDYTLAAIELSERWSIPILLRVTSRVCHTQTLVRPRAAGPPPPAPHFEHDLPGRNLIPAYARPAHRRLRRKLEELAEWSETTPLNQVIPGGQKLGIITSGVCYMHAREAAPEASFLKLGFTHPLPLKKIAAFVRSVERCVVIEENDPYLADAIRAAGLAVEGKPELFRFGELNVDRVRRILACDLSPEPVPRAGKPPELCSGCSHHVVFQALRNLDCIVAGDIGCYALGVLPPYSAMDCCVCMGSSIGIGLGLRRVLPAAEAKRVVSVIGDSTFVHSGMTGLAEMIYNPPRTGHVVVILDNSTTAMTGHQEHPGTGRTLDHAPTGRVVYEDLGRALGIEDVRVFPLGKDCADFQRLLVETLASEKLVLIVARRPCILAAKSIRDYEKGAAAQGGAPRTAPVEAGRPQRAESSIGCDSVPPPDAALGDWDSAARCPSRVHRAECSQQVARPDSAARCPYPAKEVREGETCAAAQEVLTP